LRDLNVDVYTATNHSEAQTIWNNSTPSLIFLDINLPGTNGYEVCEGIKFDENLKDVPVIFISTTNITEEKISHLARMTLTNDSKPTKSTGIRDRLKLILNF